MSLLATPPTAFQTKLFIGGAFVDAVSKKTLPVLNPATGKEICQVAEADAADVDIAVDAAKAAFATWRRTEGSFRRDCMLKLAAIIEKNVNELAVLESIDSGKPFGDAKGELEFGVKFFRYYAGWADKISGRVQPVEGQHFNFTKHQPVGVVGQIIPWNFPYLMAVWKLGPALAAGCAVVLKLAENTPLSMLHIAQYFNEAGYPPGVVNIIVGYGATAGAAIAQHPKIDKVAFTGSIPVGKLIGQMAAATNLKRVSLELGGKSPMVVTADADLDAVVECCNAAVWYNSGQVCTEAGRIYVHESVHDAFVAKLVAATAARKQGNPLEAGVVQGPMISQRQMETALRYIESGKAEGATCVHGGHRMAGSDGFFVVPTIFTNVTDSMKIAREEIFGPVAVILKWNNWDDVMRRCNDTEYGLAAGIHTKDMSLAHRFVSDIEAGIVWVNTWDTCDAACPFGGFKSSGWGRELGEYALEHYTEVKNVMWKLDFDPIKN